MARALDKEGGKRTLVTGAGSYADNESVRARIVDLFVIPRTFVETRPRFVGPLHEINSQSAGTPFAVVTAGSM